MKRHTSMMMGAVIVGWVGLLAGPAPAYEGGAVAGGGSISGTVKLAGAAPAVKPHEVNKDQNVCGKTKPNESLIVGTDKGVQYAVVRLTNIKKGKPLDTSKKPVLDQKDCHFIPHVVVVPAGATLDIKNSDPITHNVHTFGFENDPINKAQPTSLPVIPAKFEFPETIKTQCDIHKWMGAYIVVTDHPYVAVTDAKGAFKLTDVPPGTYKLEIWHEALAPVTQDVTVKGGADTAVPAELKAK
ncbi:MAG: carboxypeptidase regulatory-like domain-containing protein [Nitrospirota bacterium]